MGPDEKNMLIQTVKNIQLKVLIDILRPILKKPNSRKDLTKLLMKQSVLLRSTFLLRRENIARLMLMATISNFNSVKEENFYAFDEYYLYCIKMLTATGTDKAKAMFLECLVLTGIEYRGQDIIETPLSIEKPFLDYAKSYAGRLQIDNNQIELYLKATSDLLRHMYLENTQIIYDAAKDLQKNPQGIDSDPYYLENFRKMILWNNIQVNEAQNEMLIDKHKNKIEESLKTIKDTLLKDIIGIKNVTEHFIELSQDISNLIASSLEIEKSKKPVVCFLSQREEKVLHLNKFPDYEVVECDEKVLDCFASSDKIMYDMYEKDNKGRIIDILEGVQTSLSKINGSNDLSHRHKKQTFQCISEGKDFLISFDDVSRNTIIRMLVIFDKKYTEYQKIKAIRFVLTFRHQINKLLVKYFDNDLLQKQLHSNAVKKQMQKARSWCHSSGKEYKYVEDTYLGRYESNIDVFSEKDALYCSYINYKIDQMNFKILSNTDFDPEDESIHGETDFCSALTSVYYLSRMKKNFAYLDHKGMQVNNNINDLKHFFEMEFKGRIMLRNDKNRLPKLYDLVALIAELIYSVIKLDCDSVFMKTEEDGYFCVYNRYPEECLKEEIIQSIKRGLMRKGNGISLATTCGYFVSFYNRTANQFSAPRVKIKVDDGYVYIYLPIFQSMTTTKGELCYEVLRF